MSNDGIGGDIFAWAVTALLFLIVLYNLIRFIKFAWEG